MGYVSVVDIQILVNQYQGKPVLFVDTISQESEQLVRDIEQDLGPKDTVIVYPGWITRVKAKFDIAGLFVWHCHILSHEDNEMMRPFFVGDLP